MNDKATTGAATLAPITSVSGLVTVLASSGALGVGKPFANPICLVERTTIAGTSHIADIYQRTCDLVSGDRLTLKRDPGNSHDKWAIKVMNPRGARIGFLACDVNEIPARLMDGGKELYAQVLDVRYHKSRVNIEVEVILDD